jgi:hypothetical protein
MAQLVVIYQVMLDAQTQAVTGNHPVALQTASRMLAGTRVVMEVFSSASGNF